MRLNQLTLTHYRNYEHTALTFDRQLNVFIGNNAQGKTNLLESIYVLALTKSHRTHKDRELILNDQEFTKIQGEVERQDRCTELELIVSNKGKKAKRDKIDQAKLSQYVGNLNVVLFAPEDLALVKGSPKERRQFINMELGQMKPTYMYALSQYQHVLKQRNTYLKQLTQLNPDDLMLQVYDEQLAEYGVQISLMRRAFIEHLEKIAMDMHAQISLQKEHLTLHYHPFAEEVLVETNTEVLQQLFMKKLYQARQREFQVRSTQVGPHRDDMSMYINDRNVQNFGSQGQQRLAVLSLKLSEIELMKEETGEYPVLLLDDVMSELDNERQMQLMKVIEHKVQTFITTTTLDHLEANMQVTPAVFEVCNGHVRERE